MLLFFSGSLMSNTYIYRLLWFYFKTLLHVFYNWDFFIAFLANFKGTLNLREMTEKGFWIPWIFRATCIWNLWLDGVSVTLYLIQGGPAIVLRYLISKPCFGKNLGIFQGLHKKKKSLLWVLVFVTSGFWLVKISSES